MRQIKAYKGQPWGKKWISPIRFCELRYLPALEVVCIWIEVDELEVSRAEDEGGKEKRGSLGFCSTAHELKPLGHPLTLDLFLRAGLSRHPYDGH